MKIKTLFVSVIVVASLCNYALAYGAEYAAIIGKVLKVDQKDAKLKIQVYSENCRGVQNMHIENKEALKNIEVGQEVNLLLVTCAQAIIK